VQSKINAQFDFLLCRSVPEAYEFGRGLFTDPLSIIIVSCLTLVTRPLKTRPISADVA